MKILNWIKTAVAAAMIAASSPVIAAEAEGVADAGLAKADEKAPDHPVTKMLLTKEALSSIQRDPLHLDVRHGPLLKPLPSLKFEDRPTTSALFGLFNDNVAAASSIDDDKAESSESIVAKRSGSGRIDINVAAIDQLADLPGLDPVRARMIVQFRTVYGPFPSVRELNQVSGLSDQRIALFQDKVCAGE